MALNGFLKKMLQVLFATLEFKIPFITATKQMHFKISLSIFKLFFKKSINAFNVQGLRKSYTKGL